MSAIERFNALKEEVQEKILAKYREFNIVDGWWEPVFDDFTGRMADVGIDVEEIYFTGFYTRSDGACFKGSVDNWEKFLTSIGYTDPILIEHFSEHAIFKVRHSGRCYHENCTEFDYELPLPLSEDDEHFVYLYGCGEELRDSVMLSVLSGYDPEVLKEEFVEVFKNHMRDLYQMLEKEYEYLTSDEAVLEALEVNGILDKAIDEAVE